MEDKDRKENKTTVKDLRKQRTSKGRKNRIKEKWKDTEME